MWSTLPDWRTNPTLPHIGYRCISPFIQSRCDVNPTKIRMVQLPGLELRPRQLPGDDALVAAIYASTRADELAMMGLSGDQASAFVEMQHRAQETHYASHFPHADYDIIERNGEPLGRFWVDRGTDELRVLDITVLPQFQGQGTGTALFTRLMAEATERGVPILESVAVENVRAQALYQRLGFRTIGQSNSYISLEWRPAGD